MCLKGECRDCLYDNKINVCIDCSTYYNNKFTSKIKQLLNKSYDLEDLCDLERDVNECISNEELLEGEFEGKIRVIIEYDKDGGEEL